MTREEFKKLVPGDVIQVSSEKRFKNSFLIPGTMAEIQLNKKKGKKRIIVAGVIKKNLRDETEFEEIELTDDRDDDKIRCCWTYDAWEVYSRINEYYSYNRLKSIED